MGLFRQEEMISPQFFFRVEIGERAAELQATHKCFAGYCRIVSPRPVAWIEWGNTKSRMGSCSGEWTQFHDKIHVSLRVLDAASLVVNMIGSKTVNQDAAVLLLFKVKGIARERVPG